MNCDETEGEFNSYILQDQITYNLVIFCETHALNELESTLKIYKTMLALISRSNKCILVKAAAGAVLYTHFPGSKSMKI